MNEAHFDRFHVGQVPRPARDPLVAQSPNLNNLFLFPCNQLGDSTQRRLFAGRANVWSRSPGVRLAENGLTKVSASMAPPKHG